MTVALMIDLETLSLRPTAYITQVGYCIANRETGQYLVEPTNVLMEEQGQGSSNIDIATVRWWIQQDKDVASGVFGSENSERMSANTLHGLFLYLVEAWKVEEIWAKPAMFDLPVLTNLWKGNKPWAHWQECDLMTLSKFVDPEKQLRPPANATAHDAAADAHWQMQYLINITASLRAREDYILSGNQTLALPTPLGESLG